MKIISDARVRQIREAVEKAKGKVKDYSRFIWEPGDIVILKKGKNQDTDNDGDTEEDTDEDGE